MPDNGKPSKRVVQKPEGPKPALQVVGGAKPTGKFPKVVGSGIFGLPGQDEGVFSSDAKPIAAAGIFFNPYAVTDIGIEQPSTSWTLLRRPGQPLYPGSSARGIVLIGPSMGDNGEQQGRPWARPLMYTGLGAIGAFLFWKLILEGK